MKEHWHDSLDALGTHEVEGTLQNLVVSLLSRVACKELSIECELSTFTLRHESLESRPQPCLERACLRPLFSNFRPKPIILFSTLPSPHHLDCTSTRTA